MPLTRVVRNSWGCSIGKAKERIRAVIRKGENMTIYFCQKHYDELSVRWDGDISRAYPGEKVEINAAECVYLNCPLRKLSRCPTCGQRLKGSLKVSV